jgi:hypothetical protein
VTNTNIGAVPTLIYTPSPSGVSHVFIQNLGPSTVYVGGPGVTATGGLPVAPNQMVDFPVASIALYAVCGYTPTATATTTTAAVNSGSAVSTAITSGTGTVNGQYALIGSGTNAETALITAGGGTTTLTLGALVDDHRTGAALTIVTPFPSTVAVTAGAS